MYGQSLDCQKSRWAWILFLTCSFSLFSDLVMQMFAIPYFVFFFWIVLKDPCFVTCNHFLQEIFVTLDPFQKMKTHVLLTVLLFDCQVFWEQSSHTLFSWLILSVKIRWNMVWFKFNSLAIICTVSRRSDRTRARTFSTLLSAFEFEGLPERGSSLMDSRPSENALHHLNTCDLDKACSPRPVSVYWKFQCRFPQVRYKTWLHIVARSCALPFPWHTHKNCFTKNHIKISVLTLASWNSY